MPSKSSSQSQQLLPHAFYLKLKDDFLALYLRESYCPRQGLEQSERYLAETGQIEIEERELALLQYFKFVEEKLMHGLNWGDSDQNGQDMDEETRELYRQMDQSLSRNAELLQYLHSKLLIFSCFNE